MVKRLFEGDRWLSIMEYLETHGGSVQIARGQLAEETGIPERSLARHLSVMEDSGVIDVIRTGGDFGTGRVPNTYVLNVRAEDWDERREQIRDEWKRNRDARRREAKRRQPPPPLTPEATVEPPPTKEAVELVEAERVVEQLMDDDDEVIDEVAWAHGDG